MKTAFRSVTLDKELCKGCTNCVKRCPTEAIRVRDGKATIIKERCIDCGECIRHCPQHAKIAVVDPLESIEKFEYSIALPAPTLYGQFKKVDDVNLLLTALLRIGFDDLFEVAVAAEAVSAATRRLLAAGRLPSPAISSACPAVLQLIRVRFPELIPNVVELRTPMEFAARWAKKRAMEKTGLPLEKIGCFFISPCPAKVTSIHRPLGSDRSYVDGALSMREVYPKMLAAIKEIDGSEPLVCAGALGMGWANAGGEAVGLKRQNYLAADGIENVIRVLEDIEDERITDVDFVELNACGGGCVGGVLAVESPFIARTRIKRLQERRGRTVAPMDDMPDDINWDTHIVYEPVMRLDEDIGEAMRKLNRIRELEEKFNGMDCGACGAPSCRAMAEDIVQGYVTEDLCIFRMREKLQQLLNHDTDGEGSK